MNKKPFTLIGRETGLNVEFHFTYMCRNIFNTAEVEKKNRRAAEVSQN